MIVYLDASALVKRYIGEVGSAAVNHLVGETDILVTAVISSAEVAAALAKAARVGSVDSGDAGTALQVFLNEWNDLVRVQLTETVANRAGGLAREPGLRGHDSVHLATVLFWQETIGDSIVLITFDRQS